MPGWWKGKWKSSSKVSLSPRKNESAMTEFESGGETPNHRRESKKEKGISFDEVTTSRKSVDHCPLYVVTDGNEFVFGHPLPLPTSISCPVPVVHQQGVGSISTPSSASASVSVSSINSSGSSDDNPGLRFSDPINMLRGRKLADDIQRHWNLTEDEQCSPVLEHRKKSRSSASQGKEFQLHVEAPINNGAAYSYERSYVGAAFGTRNASPSTGSGARCHSASPVHTRSFGLPPASPNLRQDPLRSPPHPLPLPPFSPSTSVSSLQSPKLQWKKGKLLGRGTFGHVYFGFNSETGQMCAIKEVKDISDDNNSKECLRQLNQEISLLSQLSHPNIVQYYGSELAVDTLSIYLEYVSGGSIHKLLQDYGPLSEPLIRSYTAQILSGLVYLHGRNTVHRDIKGANILVAPNGEIKLADFGMAKHISSYASIHSFKGSPYWMAPEVIMSGNGYNLSVDIWSLGCTVIEMATGKPPWSQFEGVAAIFKIANSKEIPEIPDHFSLEGKDFLRLCLQRDLRSRPSASRLMDHPFVRDQSTIKSAKHNLIEDVQSSSCDGKHIVVSSEFTSNKSTYPQYDGDHDMKQHPGFSAFHLHNKNTSDFPMMRMNLSLPVSPCSSPIRQFKQSHQSCLPSPPHQSFSPYSPVNYALSPTRLSPNLDQWSNISYSKAQTPYGSPGRLSMGL